MGVHILSVPATRHRPALDTAAPPPCPSAAWWFWALGARVTVPSQDGRQGSGLRGEGTAAAPVPATGWGCRPVSGGGWRVPGDLAWLVPQQGPNPAEPRVPGEAQRHHGGG